MLKLANLEFESKISKVDSGPLQKIFAAHKSLYNHEKGSENQDQIQRMKTILDRMLQILLNCVY